MSVKTLARSFSGGEISPEMFGRVDLTQFQTGLSEVTNMIVLPHGPVRARKGTKFVGEAKYPDKKVALIEFSFNNEQSYAIELGHLYLRVHTQGSTLKDLTAGTTNHPPYEFATPYAEQEAFDIHYVQSADVMTLVHPKHTPRNLIRQSYPVTIFGVTYQQIAIGVMAFVYFGQAEIIPALSNPGINPLPPSGRTGTPVTHTYGYTVVNLDTGEESAMSGPNSTSNDLTVVGQTNHIYWNTPGNPEFTTTYPNIRYRIYKYRNGLFGYIGETAGSPFIDNNIVPDVTRTPPNSVTLFTAAGDYPSAVCYFEQRRCFAGSLNKPQNFWATRAGTENNMSYSVPTRDDDAIYIRIISQRASRILHLIPLGDLLALTSEGEARIYTQNSDVFSPLTVSARMQSYTGASNVQPVTIGEYAIYVRAQSGRLQEISYDNAAYAYRSNDISIMAPHLFDGYDIVDMAVSRTPFPVVWAVRNDGVLLGLTYMPAQKVWAWHKHDVGGEVESIAGIAEGKKDVLYISVKRTINGVTKRYIEYLDLTEDDNLESAFHVDSGLTYDGPPVTQLTGLSHLEGQEVAIFADGAEHPRRTVVGGAVTLDYAVTKAAVGLPITAEITTLPITLQAEAFAQGTIKNVNQVYVRVHQSGPVQVGAKKDRMVSYQARTDSDFGATPSLQTAELKVEIPPNWNGDGKVTVRSTSPTPLTVVSLVMDVALGG